MSNTANKIILITGASSGIGYETARMFADNGDFVYCASRSGKTPGGSAPNVRSLKMDVTDNTDVKNGVNSILCESGRIDILVHCAGNGYFGPLEVSTKVDMSVQMDVNLFAAQTLVNAVLPSMRERGSGVLLFVGSVGGMFAIPYQTLYSCSKAALSIYVEGLRLELKPFRVRAAVIEPGDVKTGFTKARAKISVQFPDAYLETCAKAVSRMERDEVNGMSPAKVAKAILKAAQKKNPRARTVVGIKYKLFVFAKKILPYLLVEKVLYWLYLG